METHLFISNFKKIPWRKIGIIFLLFFLSDQIIGFSFKKLTDKVSGYWFRRHLKIEHVINHQYDYLIFGSSRSMYSINPIELNKNLNLVGFNSSIEASDISFFIDVLKILEKQGNMPKRLLFNIYAKSIIEGEINYNNVFNILGPLSVSSELFEKSFPVESKLSFINSLKYHKVLPDLINGLRKSGKPSDYGYRPVYSKGLCELGDNCKSGKPFSESDWIKLRGELSDPYYGYLDELLQIVERNKLNVVFTISPVHSVLNIDMKSSYFLWEKVKVYLEDKGHYVLDYRMSEQFYSNDEYYTDAIHLNSKGAKLFSKILAQDLKKLNF